MNLSPPFSAKLLASGYFQCHRVFLLLDREEKQYDLPSASAICHEYLTFYWLPPTRLLKKAAESRSFFESLCLLQVKKQQLDKRPARQELWSLLGES